MERFQNMSKYNPIEKILNSLNYHKERLTFLELKTNKRYNRISERLEEEQKEETRKLEKEGHDLLPTFLNTEEGGILRDELIKISNDKNTYIYHININGLISYMLGEHKNEALSKCLTNLGKNFSSEFPFLLNYEKFENIL